MPDVDPLAADARFTALFARFVAVFAGDSPLVLFLDDLQWSDAASLKLLRTLMTETSPLQLLIVGAYRDNEVSAAHPLVLALDELEKANVHRTDIVLSPLAEEDITDLVADTLRTETYLVSAFAAVLSAKTGGNPFFLIQFFETVHNEGLVWREPESGMWSWNEGGIARLQSTDNVIELMVRRLKELPEDTQSLLRFAACIGTVFDLSGLSTVTRTHRAAAAERLWPAIDAGLVVPLLGTSRFDETDDRPTALDVPTYMLDLAEDYRFLHDRVQQGAYLLSEDAERPAMHQQIGWLLHDNIPPREVDEQVFDIVDHLNIGQDLIPADRRLTVARLNLVAATKARASTAYSAAGRYAETAQGLLPDDAWTSHYEVMRELVPLRGDCRYLLGDADGAEELFDAALEHVRDAADKVRIHNQKAVMSRHRNRYGDGLRAAIDGLAVIGIEVPWHDDNDRIGELMGELSAKVGEQMAALGDVEQLLDLPRATDPVHGAAMDLLEEVVMVGYFFNPALIQIGTMYIVSASLKNGNSAGSAPAYATYGMTIASAAGLYEAGEKIGRVGLELARREGGSTLSRTTMWYAAMLAHWRASAMECVHVLKEGVEAALRVGIPVSAGYNSFFVPVAARIAGMRLDELQATIDRYKVFMDPESGEATVAYQQLLRSLRGEIPGGGQFEGGAWHEAEDLDEPTYVQFMHDSGLALSRQHYYNAKTQLLAYWNRAAEAMPVIALAKSEGDMAAVLFGQLINSEWALFQCLAIASSWTLLSDEERTEHGATFEGHLTQLRVWADNAPMNFEQMHALASAEHARIHGDDEAATRHYDAAIDAARSGGHSHLEALAAERAARFHTEGGREGFAGGYLTLAHTRYTLWGATAKADALAREFPEALAEAGGATTALRQSDLDVATVVQAFQAMSQEIELHALLERMLGILVRNAGAETGSLLLSHADGLRVEAVGTADGVDIVDSAPLSDRPELPASLIAYVNRTGETVVVDDVQQHRRFAADPAVQEQGLRSALCMPIVHGRRTLGLLYLSNSLSPGVFTPDRAALLKILGTQAAISIENARLFESQKRQAESFARFVPQQFLEHIGRDTIEDVQLGDAVQESISVLFSDLRNFTSLSESLSAEENFRWLNGYLGYVSPVIEQHAGFIDKFIGDAVMALFPAGGDQAVGAAIELHAALRRFNRASEVAFETKMGVGVHTGPLMLGTVGSRGRMDTTVIGDAVNLAARLESLTKYFDVSVLISEATRQDLERLADTPVRTLGQVRVKGRTEATALYEVLAADSAASRDAKLGTLGRFNEGTAMYYDRRFAEAAKAFEDCLVSHPGDIPAQRFVERAARLVTAPPPADWDGTESLGFK